MDCEGSNAEVATHSDASKTPFYGNMLPPRLDAFKSVLV
jgi:hypothetical protein